MKLKTWLVEGAEVSQSSLKEKPNLHYRGTNVPIGKRKTIGKMNALKKPREDTKVLELEELVLRVGLNSLLFLR